MKRSAYYIPLVLIVLFSVFIHSCTKDEGPILVEDDIIVVDTISFSNEIVPIFVSHCWPCHPPTAGLDLSAAGSYNSLINVMSTNYPPFVRVKPFYPDSSVLYHKVAATNQAGPIMPPVGSLSVTDINLIKDWIEQGALNN
jgi:hypothetical protein